MELEYDVYLLDLDGTLIDEREYLEAAYSLIAEYLAGKYFLNAGKLFSFLVNTFLYEGREWLFQKLFRKFEIPFEELDAVIDKLHNAPVVLNVYPKMKRLLEKIKGKVYICTNGNEDQQRNKIKRAGLEKYIDGVYHTNKPDSGGLRFEGALMIGDSELDRKFAENVGADFIYVYLLHF